MLRVEADELLSLQGQLAAGGVGLDRRQRVLDLESVAEESDDRAEVLERDLLGAVFAQVAGHDELTPGDGVDAGGAFADDGGVGLALALVAVDPAAESVGAQPEEPRSLAHVVDRAVEQLHAGLSHEGQCAPSG